MGNPMPASKHAKWKSCDYSPGQHALDGVFQLDPLPGILPGCRQITGEQSVQFIKHAV